jgi:hypothetical protein
MMTMTNLSLLAAAGPVSSDVEPFTGWENLVLIASKPDNVPIIMMMVIFAFFTYLALRDAFKHDKLIKEGRKADILKSMQE